jgi:hypothetical protein
LIRTIFEGRLQRALALLTLTAIVTAACGNQTQPPVIHATLVVPAAGYVLLNEPVEVSFNRTVKNTKAITFTPTAEVTATKQGKKLLLSPVSGWLPATSYQVRLGGVTTTDGGTLKTFSATFSTQPRHGVAGFLVGGQPVTGEPTIPATAHVSITFTDAMNVRTTLPTLNGQPVAAGGFKWADDGKSVEITSGLLPYQTYVYGVGGQPVAANGEALTDVSTITVHPVPVEPSNEASAIPTGFKTIPPLQIVIEDSGDARPQTGFQKADMVFEYISEFSINRMAAFYFNHVPDTVGPVRSCRTINAFLVFAFEALLMCSGVARGTQHYVPGGSSHGTKPAPGVIADQEVGTTHFYRSNNNFAPHNLYTSSALAESLRTQINPGDPSTVYVVDPQHPDNGLGQPVDPPSVGLHGVTYAFDAGSQQYLRFERGTPFMEASTNAQLKVKNIVVMHVPFHNTDWSEDGCCAWSVWYEMVGTGPAELYSDGKLIHTTWHMGTAGQVYFENNQPIWFSDDATGLVVELNTGVTWIHVMGNGQNS